MLQIRLNFELTDIIKSENCSYDRVALKG